MNCHDIRKLTVCSGCQMPGDKRAMVPTDLQWWHGLCFIEEFGEDRFMALPPSHVAGLTIDDVGAKLMKAWLDSHYPTGPRSALSAADREDTSHG